MRLNSFRESFQISLSSAGNDNPGNRGERKDQKHSNIYSARSYPGTHLQADELFLQIKPDTEAPTYKTEEELELSPWKLEKEAGALCRRHPGELQASLWRPVEKSFAAPSYYFTCVLHNWLPVGRKNKVKSLPLIINKTNFVTFKCLRNEKIMTLLREKRML